MLREATNPPRSWRDTSLAQLTLVRFREFLREPEAVLWTFPKTDQRAFSPTTHCNARPDERILFQ